MNFILTSKCFANCKFCFVPPAFKTKRREMSFADVKKYIDHINKSYKQTKPSLGILGGEPTAAKDFALIAGYLKCYKGFVRIYSNLASSKKNMAYFAGSKNIAVVWNIGAYLNSSQKNRRMITENIKFLKKQKTNIIASITLYTGFKTEDFVKAAVILKKYGIKQIRIALDSTNHQKFINCGDGVFSLCSAFKKQGFEIISSYCGHFLKGMFDKKQEIWMKDNILNFNYNDCSKNFPVDILPGGAAVPCMAFCTAKTKIKLTDFKSYSSLKRQLRKTYPAGKIKKGVCVLSR